MGYNKYLIYQLKIDIEKRDFQYESLERLNKAGRSVDWRNYNHIYTGILDPGVNPVAADLEKIYLKFNNDRPEDYPGYSLSTSDIVVLSRNDIITAYYVDKGNFIEVPDFLSAPYKYYSTQRPIDINTYPITDGGPDHFINFTKREYMENCSFQAWGYLAYNTPLDTKQIYKYELKAASGNPDNICVPPYQFAAQLEVIGKWEDKNQLSMARLTWYHKDFGVYVKKDHVMNWQVEDLFNDITEIHARDAAKRVEKTIEKHVQVVGVWEEQNGMPDKERYTCYIPSIPGYALREPTVSQELLRKRYHQAKRELNNKVQEETVPISISKQIKDAEKNLQRGINTLKKIQYVTHEGR